MYSKIAYAINATFSEFIVIYGINATNPSFSYKRYFLCLYCEEIHVFND